MSDPIGGMDHPHPTLLGMATAIGEHTARIHALEEDVAHIQEGLDDIDAKLKHMEDLADTASDKQDRIGEQLADLVTKFTADAPLTNYVRQLQAATATQLARTEQRHRAILQRVNVLLPLAIALLASTLLRNVDVLGQNQMDIQYGITGVTTAYIVLALLLTRK